MADSFFGFDTSLSNVNDRDDGGGREASEDEYDALNDETFGGSGEDGDWEQQHEELSMLTEVDKHQSDLEAFLSHLVLEEYDEYSSEAASPIPPQPVQQSSTLSNIAQAPPAWLKNACTVEELERNMMRQQQPSSQQKQQQANQQQHSMNQQQQQHMSQQQMGQQQKLQQTLLLPPQLQKLQQQKMPQPNVQQNMQQQSMQLPVQQNIQMQHPAMPMLMPFFQNRFPTGIMPPGLPPPMLGPRPPFLTGPPPPIHPFGNFNQLPPNKMPPGLLRPQHTLTNLQTIEQQQQQNNLHHPNHHPQMNNLQHPISNMQQSINNMNQPMNNINNLNKINQPLMGGINQGMNKMNPAMNVHLMQQQSQMNISHRPNQQQQIPFKHQNSVQQQMNQSSQKKPNGRSDERVFSQEEVMQIIQETHPLLQKSNMQKFRRPKTLEEFMGNHIQGMQRRGEGDQYSGLMSQREKQWLLNIQLMQLNTGTPYMDDYYYTVFLDRQARKEKQQEMKEAHKANQQNHPFSQQNLTNTRFHGSSSGNGEGGRERRNSSRSTGDGTSTNKDGPRHYVPTQFENSLGKLQCGSVTAPRKIMDMEVVSDSATGQGSAGPTGASRSSRQTLLAIESLFRGLLRVEDLSEPLAIANALVLKEREEKQKALLLEQQQRDALEDDEAASSPPNSDSANHFLRGIESVVKNQQQQKEVATSIGSLSSSSQPNLLDENKTELLGKLLAGLLFEDRLAAFLNVRKGKLLVTRILAQATPAEWWRAPLGRLWPRLLRCLPYACRRDSHCLGPIVQHFRSYLNGTEGWAPVSDLCTVLTEGAAQQPSQRANTPALLQQRGLMHFLLSSQLGLSLLVALSERAAALPRPVPAAWTALVRAAAKQALQAPTATAVSVRPVHSLSRAVLATHATSAGLSVPEEEALSELLC